MLYPRNKSLHTTWAFIRHAAISGDTYGSVTAQLTMFGYRTIRPASSAEPGKAPGSTAKATIRPAVCSVCILRVLLQLAIPSLTILRSYSF